MDDKLKRMVQALAPAMRPTTAEVCLRGTALAMRKPVEQLSAQDLPALEASVRSALRGVASESSIELTVHNLRRIFLESVEANGC